MLTGILTPVSNQADWIDAFELIDTDTDEPIDIEDATEIVVEVRRHGNTQAELTASLSDGTVEHIETGVFQWTFSVGEMQDLDAEAYDVFVRITKDEIVTQLFIGTVPVVNG